MYSLFSYEAIVSDYKALRRHRLAFRSQEPSDFFQYVQVPKIRLLKDWSNIRNRLVVQTKHHRLKLGFTRSSLEIRSIFLMTRRS